MTEGPDVPFEELDRHCFMYGHVWRYFSQSGQRLRVCVYCGRLQTYADGGWAE